MAAKRTRKMEGLTIFLHRVEENDEKQPCSVVGVVVGAELGLVGVSGAMGLSLERLRRREDRERVEGASGTSGVISVV